ncbi:MAG: hypothetical protein NXI32_02330 [bacterium]|nr:hypothetical protein [bacterium]
MSNSDWLEVRTGCRLHFGLMEVCPRSRDCYSGLGLMLTEPSFVVRVAGRVLSGEPVLQAPPQLIARLKKIHGRWQALHSGAGPAKISVPISMPLHHGLGAGTQLACAAMSAFHLLGNAKALSTSTVWTNCQDSLFDTCSAMDERLDWLAKQTGRGLRSAIGLRGFLDGGLILDGGNAAIAKSNFDSATSSQRTFATTSVYLPDSWRVVLILPRNAELVWGSREARLIHSIANQSHEHAATMRKLANEILASISHVPDLESFGGMLAEYMRYAGAMFSRVQGGQYSHPATHKTVAIAQSAGLQGVGQSSWGPTVFGFANSAEQALLAVRELESSSDIVNCEVMIAQPAQHGACFRTGSD